MRFILVKLILFFFLIGISNSTENIRFININYIVNNSDAGISLNKILDDKNKKISSELNELGKKLEKKKNKIVSQKNILKKAEFDNLVKDYDKDLKDFNNQRKTKTDLFNTFRVNSKKKNYWFIKSINYKLLKKRINSNITPKR